LQLIKINGKNFTILQLQNYNRNCQTDIRFVISAPKLPLPLIGHKPARHKSAGHKPARHKLAATNRPPQTGPPQTVLFRLAAPIGTASDD
jgi:hypothetical protein